MKIVAFHVAIIANTKLTSTAWEKTAIIDFVTKLDLFNILLDMKDWTLFVGLNLKASEVCLVAGNPVN